MDNKAVGAMSFEGEIQRDLELPFRSFRLMAIDDAIQRGASKELLDALKDRRTREDDPECQNLLEIAVSILEKRVSPEPSQPEGRESAETEVSFPVSRREEKLRFLGRISRSELVVRASEAPRWLLEETDPTVASLLVKTFEGVWPRGEVAVLRRNLFSSHLCIRYCVLSALIRIDPQLLREDLPRLLTSSDTRQRSVAILGLAKIDFPEAVFFLDELLKSDNPEHRVAGLKNCCFLPFEPIKGILLGFLAREPELELLDRAGLIFSANPDPEIPFRVWELARNAQPPRSGILRSIHESSIQALKVSRILGDRFQEYSQYLEEWKKGKSESVAPPPEKPSEALLHPVSAPEADSDPVNLKIRELSSFGNADQEKAKPIVDEILASEDSQPPLVSAALKAAGRLGFKSWKEKAIGKLSSKNEIVVAAAAEFLSDLFPDVLLPYLGKFLQSTNPRLFSLAIRFLKKQDEPEALSKVKSLLGSSNPVLKGLGLSGMIHFPFMLVREILADFLERENDEDLFLRGLSLFFGNPEVSNLICLFRLEKKQVGVRASRVADVRGKNRSALEKLRILKENDPEFSDEAFATVIKKEEELAVQSKNSPPKEYSLKALGGGGRAAGSASGKHGGPPGEHDSFSFWMGLGVGLVVFCILLFVSMGKPKPSEAPRAVGTTSETRVFGRVMDLGEKTGIILIKLDNQDLLYLRPNQVGFKDLAVGDQITALVIPLPELFQGMKTAKVRTFAKRL